MVSPKLPECLSVLQHPPFRQAVFIGIRLPFPILKVSPEPGPPRQLPIFHIPVLPQKRHHKETDERHPRFDPRYKKVLSLPATESLKDTLERVSPYWLEQIAPRLQANENVLIAAHGNSLRALVKMLDGISDEEITEFNIPTGVPILYDLDDALKPRSREFIGDPEAIRKATEAVADQATASTAK